MAADDLGSVVGYMSDGEMPTINAPKDSDSVYWDNNLKILNSFGEITLVTFPPCQDSELRLFILIYLLGWPTLQWKVLFKRTSLIALNIGEFLDMNASRQTQKGRTMRPLYTDFRLTDYYHCTMPFRVRMESLSVFMTVVSVKVTVLFSTSKSNPAPQSINMTPPVVQA